MFPEGRDNGGQGSAPATPGAVVSCTQASDCKSPNTTCDRDTCLPWECDKWDHECEDQYKEEVAVGTYVTCTNHRCRFVRSQCIGDEDCGHVEAATCKDGFCEVESKLVEEDKCKDKTCPAQQQCRLE